MREECNYAKGLPSQRPLQHAAFLTPRLHEYRDLHSGKENGTRRAPSLDHQPLPPNERGQ